MADDGLHHLIQELFFSHDYSYAQFTILWYSKTRYGARASQNSLLTEAEPCILTLE